MINSEYGAVSAGGGDRDISWGLRDLTTQLRRHPKIQGFVYTELTDIEWEHNGLVNYDRTPKVFGYDTWLPDMRPSELLGADFIGYDAPPAIVGKPGETITVPIFVSHFSDRSHPGQAALVGQRLRFQGRHPHRGRAEELPDHLAAVRRRSTSSRSSSRLPDYPFVGALALTLRDEQNQRFAANFVNLVVKPDRPLPRIQRRGDHDVTIRFAPGDYSPGRNGPTRQVRRRERSTGTARAISSTGSSSRQRSSRPIPSRSITSSRPVPRPSASALTGRSGSTARTIPRPTRTQLVLDAGFP